MVLTKATIGRLLFSEVSDDVSSESVVVVGSYRIATGLDDLDGVTND